MDCRFIQNSTKSFFSDSTNAQRADVIVSETELSWDGTSENANECSYAQKISKLKSSGIDSSGRTLLFAPETFFSGSSVKHLSPNIGDIMQHAYPLPADMS